MATVFVTGGTGYLGRPVIEARPGRGRMAPRTSDSAIRLGLATPGQVVTEVVAAVETPPRSGARIVDVPGIAQAQLRT